jgi:steroid delta-isomerase-like uncharacterized protein
MTEENRAIVRRWYEEVWNRGKLDAIDELFAPTFLRDGRTTTPDALKESVARTSERFPDARWSVEDLVAEGEKVVTRFTARGTLRESWDTTVGTIAPGRTGTLRGMRMFRLAEGRIVEWWTVEDMLGFYEELGAGLGGRSGGSAGRSG